MKKLFSIIALATCLTSLPEQSVAQNQTEIVVKSAADTSVDADTLVISFTNIGSNVKSFQASVSRLSGTAAGTVILQGTVDGNWVTLKDTMTLSNQATNTKVWPICQTTYTSYRAYYIASGTQTSKLTFSYMRRPDEPGCY